MAPGDTVRQYELVSQIGEGGFGTVYRARMMGRSGFQKAVAVKLLRADRDPALVQRLRDEARLLALLRHRAIVAVDDLIELDGSWAVVMEFVEGADLGALLAHRAIPVRVTAEIAREVALALVVAHGAAHPETGEPLRIVHRDIKPANIRITPAGDVKLLDFGIARACWAAREAVTGSFAMGTVGYMAPERMEGIDQPASDLFALGVVLFECASGTRLRQLPFRPDVFEEVLGKALERVPSDALRETIAALLAYEPAQRPDAAEAARLLQAVAVAETGPWLAEWAPGALREVDPELGRAVPPADRDSPSGARTQVAPDSLSRRTAVVEESLELDPPTATPTPARRVGRLVGAGALLAFGGMVGVVAFGAAWWARTRPAPVAVPIDPAPIVEPIPPLPVASVAKEQVEPVPVPDEGLPEDVKPDETAEAAPPRPPPPPATGTVKVDGLDAPPVLIGADGRERAPGAVPPGTYDLRFSFDGGPALTQRGLVVVRGGEQTAILCDALAQRCRVR